MTVFFVFPRVFRPRPSPPPPPPFPPSRLGAGAVWGGVAGIAVAWTAYPALTDNFKHNMLPFIFPSPEVRAVVSVWVLLPCRVLMNPFPFSPFPRFFPDRGSRRRRNSVAMAHLRIHSLCGCLSLPMESHPHAVSLNASAPLCFCLVCRPVTRRGRPPLRTAPQTPARRTP